MPSAYFLDCNIIYDAVAHKGTGMRIRKQFAFNAESL
jgi:hypothetical protein